MNGAGGLLWGFHPIREALRERSEEIAKVLVAASRGGGRRAEILALCAAHRVAVQVLPDAELERRAPGVHNGFLAELVMAPRRLPLAPGGGAARRFAELPSSIAAAAAAASQAASAEAAAAQIEPSAGERIAREGAAGAPELGEDIAAGSAGLAASAPAEPAESGEPDELDEEPWSGSDLPITAAPSAAISSAVGVVAEGGGPARKPGRPAAPAAAVDAATAAALRAAGDPDLRVLVEDVQDPRNLGALLRVCEGAGVRQVLVRDRGSAPLGATAAKTSAGAVAHLDIERIPNSAAAIERAQRDGFWVYALDAGGDPPWTIDLTGKVMICVGGEEKGLRERTRKLCDGVIGLPMRGQIESLNLSTAAAAVLYEAVRQRLTKKRT